METESKVWGKWRLRARMGEWRLRARDEGVETESKG